MVPRKAIVAGATGVVGRYILAHLVRSGDWRVVAVSRRRPDIAGGYEHIAVDLLDGAQARAGLGGLDDITHVFFAAYSSAPTRRRWSPTISPCCAIFSMRWNLRRPVSSTSTWSTAASGTAAISGLTGRRPGRPIRATCRPTSTTTSRTT